MSNRLFSLFVGFIFLDFIFFKFFCKPGEVEAEKRERVFARVFVPKGWNRAEENFWKIAKHHRLFTSLACCVGQFSQLIFFHVCDMGTTILVICSIILNWESRNIRRKSIWAHACAQPNNRFSFFFISSPRSSHHFTI